MENKETKKINIPSYWMDKEAAAKANAPVETPVPVIKEEKPVVVAKPIVEVEQAPAPVSVIPAKNQLKPIESLLETIPPGDPREKSRQDLLMLQQRLIINNVGNCSFKTEIYGDVQNVYDVSQMLTQLDKQGLKTLIKTGENEFLIKDKKNHYINGFDIKTTKTFKRLKEQSLSRMHDTGENDFYMGWPFVDGIIKTKGGSHFQNTGNVFYAPLLFWPVKIDVNDDGIPSLHLFGHQEAPQCYVNTSILEKASIMYGIKKDISEFLHKNLYESNAAKLWEKVAAIYKIFNIVLTNVNKKEFEECFNKMRPNKFVNLDTVSWLKGERHNEIKNFCVVGVFPSNDVGLYNDYNKMLSKDGVDFLQTFKNYTYDAVQKHVEASIPFKEGNIKTITHLDYPQKKAVKIAMDESCVIQGPPGTGKSETISNIIANMMFRLRSSLFVVEKQTAGEIVHNRLRGLRRYTLKLFEDISLNKEFTKQLRSNVEHIGRMIELRDQLLAEGNANGDDLDEIFARVDKFKKIMAFGDGKKFPKFQLDYNKKKEEIKKAVDLCSGLLNRSKNAREFWNGVRQAKMDNDEFHLLKTAQDTESWRLDDETFVALFDINKNYDNTAEFFDVFLKKWVDDFAARKFAQSPVANIETPKVEETKEKRGLFRGKKANKLETKQQTPVENESVPQPAPSVVALYEKVKKCLQSFDDATLDAFLKHNGIWYSKLIQETTNSSYQNLIKFANEYTYEKFDYAMAKNYRKMLVFASDNADVLNIDDENYYDEIKDILKDKEEQDLKECEYNLLKNIFKVLDDKTDTKVRDEFNRLYAFVRASNSVASVKETFKKYAEVISLLFPAIICSPKVVSDFIPCERGLFNVILFDEASQITLEKGVPIIYRGDKFCIVGDSNQLPPESYFESLKQRKQLQEKIAMDDTKDIEELAIESAASLLDYAQRKVPLLTLNYHYRSKTADLIAFNNVAFYSNKLNVANNPKRPSTGLKVIDVQGTYQNLINEAEARKAVEVVESIVKQKKHGTIGIITFSKEMRDYVADLIINHKNKAIGNEMYRYKMNGEFEGLFIKHVNTVQGEERDNIIVCCGFSNDVKTDRLFEDSIGILNTEIGRNYINVMFSRAKQNLTIIKSFKTIDLDVNELNENSKCFVDYLKYAELFSVSHDLQNDEDIKALFIPYMRENGEFDLNIDVDESEVSGEIDQDSKLDWLTKEVTETFNELIDTNQFMIVNNKQEGLVKINICFTNKKDGSIPLGLICNRFVNNINLANKERDFYAKKFLINKDWRIFDISALQWCKTYKREEVINKVKLLCHKYGVALKEERTKPKVARRKSKRSRR